MKKSILFGPFAYLLLGTTVNAQISQVGNGAPGAAADYVGWNATRPFALTVSHKGNFPINFETNSINRMTITPTGLVGIGQITPLSLLHINSNGNTINGELFRTTGPSNQTNAWRMFTGAGNGIERFGIFVPTNSNNAILRTNVSDASSPGNVLIRTGGDLNRLKLNGSYSAAFPQYGIGAYNIAMGVNTSGYMLLSSNPASALYNNNSGAWSLLHLDGEGSSSPNAYRPWMKTGITFTAGADLGYLGYRVLTNPTTQNGLDRTEMTIAWSNDQPPVLNNSGPEFGPDDMVFRFLGWAQNATTVSLNANTVNADNTIISDLDGLHVARFTPTGFFAIGPNFGWQFDDTYIGPNQRLDVEGNGRFRRLPTIDYIANDSVTKVVMVDEMGVLRWLNFNDLVQEGPQGPAGTNGLDGAQGPAGTNGMDGAQGPQGEQGIQGEQGPIGLTGPQGPQGPAGQQTLAHNGTSMSTLAANHVAFGQNVNEVNNPGRLLNTREIPMNNNNILFTNPAGSSPNVNNIGIGTASPQAKLHIESANATNLLINGTGQFGALVNATGSNGIHHGVRSVVSNGTNEQYGVSSNVSGNTANTSFGSYFVARDAKNNNYGSYSIATSSLGSQNNTGVFAEASNAANNNIGGNFNVTSSNNNSLNIGVNTTISGNALYNYGVNSVISGGTVINYAIYGRVNGISGTSNYAGYFDGKLRVNGISEMNGNVNVNGVLTTPTGTVTASDAMFKTNVNNLSNALDLINQLSPKTYYFDTTAYDDFNFENDVQMGLIAQEVEAILPAIVSNHVRPAQYDSLGNETQAELTYKGIEYEELLPLAIAGIQELNAKNDEKDSIISLQQATITNLNDRLTQLENCLSGILPHLCQMSQSAIETNTPITQEAVRAQLAVKLNNKDAIILDQNVPNPFAEQTVINFSIPATVAKAQLHFYSAEGKLMQSVDVKDRGLGSITVFGSDLSSGTYTYSLVADGIVVATKRMVKE
jgi:hypothetical protein